MVNGLALAETTPGPLIMVVQFVGFVTGPIWSTARPGAVFVTVLAFVLVLRYKFSVLRVLGICAAVGATIHLAVS